MLQGQGVIVRIEGRGVIFLAESVAGIEVRAIFELVAHALDVIELKTVPGRCSTHEALD